MVGEEVVGEVPLPVSGSAIVLLERAAIAPESMVRLRSNHADKRSANHGHRPRSSSPGRSTCRELERTASAASRRTVEEVCYSLPLQIAAATRVAHVDPRDAAYPTSSTLDLDVRRRNQ